MSLATNLSSITTPFTGPLETNESYGYAQFGSEDRMYDTSTCQTFKGGDTVMLDEPPLPVPKYPPSRDDWDRYRAIFTHLYQVEEKPLKAAKELLEVQYGFKATERMYKKRISEWKVKKNYNKGEKDAVCRSLQRRTQAGKNSHHVKIRDQPVKFQRILRHMKASTGVAAAQSSNDHHLYRDDDEVQVQTPEPEIILDDLPKLRNTHFELLQLNLTSGPARPISTRDDLGSAEIMCFESVRYLETMLPLQAQGRPSFLPGQNRPFSTFSLVAAAASQSHLKRYLEARILLNKACDALKNDLDDAGPSLLSRLLRALSTSHLSQSPFKVRRLFHEHAAELCTIYLGVGHPITIIMRSLFGVRDRTRVVNAILGSLLATAIEHSELPSAHILAMKLTVYKSQVLDLLRQYQEAKEILQRAIISCTSLYGPCHQLALILLLSLAWLDYDSLQNYAEAEVLFRRVLLNNADKEGARPGPGETSAALEGLARIAERQGDLRRAVKLRWEALDTCVKSSGHKAGSTVHMAHNLEKLLGKSGQYVDADHVRAAYLSEVDPSA